MFARIFFKFQFNTKSENSIENMLVDSLPCIDNEYMHESCCYWVFMKYTQWKFYFA